MGRYIIMISNDNTTTETIAASQYNHSCILCGACQPSFSLDLGNEWCLPCSNKYLALLIPFTLAGLVLVSFIKLLHLTVSQGTINGLIFYANVIQANHYNIIFLPWRSTHILLSVFIAMAQSRFGFGDRFFQGTECLIQNMAPVCFSLLYLEHCRTHYSLKVQQ